MKSNIKFFKKSKVLPVDEFFNNVLYNDKFGYYSSQNPFGKEGDFITAPKITLQETSVALPTSSPFIKLAIRPKKIPIGATQAITSSIKKVGKVECHFTVHL